MLLEIFCEVRAVFEVVTDDLINTRQLEAGKILNDLLGRRAAVNARTTRSSVTRVPAIRHTPT
jgi:hypothetical protein